MHPQQPLGTQQYQPGPPPGYGMQQMPYYPPQKQGMPGWAWALIICGAGFALMIVGILFLAAIPLITSNTRDARRAEGEQMLGIMTGQARVAYSRKGVAPTRLTGSIDLGGSGVSPAELEGKYYRIDDSVRKGTRSDAMLTATPKAASDGVGTQEFNWAGGEGKLSWR